MKFNPIAKSLFTDDNKLIKKIHCPYPSLKWGDLSSTDGDIHRFCSICEHNVIETKDYSDKALLQLLQDEPNTCLKIDFNQDNVRITHHV